MKENINKTTNKKIWRDFESKAHLFDPIIQYAKNKSDPFLESILIRNLILFFSGKQLQAINNLTNRLYIGIEKKFFIEFYLLLLNLLTEKKQLTDNQKPKYIFGLGTGRNGSTSLYHLFKEQPNTFSSHEYPPIIPWEGDAQCLDFHLRRTALLSKAFQYQVDVSHWWLPHVETIMKHNPDSIFICLRRNKKDTINSFLKIKGYGKTGAINHWMRHDGRKWQFNFWDRAYPKYNVQSMPEALEQYWNQYYQTCEQLEKKYPIQIKLFETENLSEKEEQIRILEFCGYKDPITSNEIKKNVSSVADGIVGWKDLEKLASS